MEPVAYWLHLVYITYNCFTYLQVTLVVTKCFNYTVKIKKNKLVTKS